jgi:hypothetical protein
VAKAKGDTIMIEDQLAMFEKSVVNLAEGKRRRDAGIRKATESVRERWRDSYYLAVEQWFVRLHKGERFTGESLRLAALEGGVRNPQHHNAWGAVSRAVLVRWLREDRIEPAGHAQAQAAKAHARLYPAYRVK